MANKMVNVGEKLEPAVVVIFNHVQFCNGLEERFGSAQDVKALVEVFQKFGCVVNVITDPTKATVNSTVKGLEQKNFKEHSALVIVILSHGGYDNQIIGNDLSYSLDYDVLFPILRNPTLVDKPKIFLVQACKGEMVGLRPDAAKIHANPNEVLKCYSTFEGFVSFRSANEGSYFIQTFCKTLEEYGDKIHIENILTKVRVIVTQKSNHRQIPSVLTTMTKPYIFGDYIYKMDDDMDEIYSQSSLLLQLVDRL